MKRCTKCTIEKPEIEFGPYKKGRDGLFPQCKTCCVERARAWAVANPERAKAKGTEWDVVNRERMLLARRAKIAADPEAERQRRATQYAANSPKIKARVRAYKAANHDKIITDVRNSKARRRGAPGRHTKAETDALLIAQNYCCASPHCRVDLRDVKKHLDHKTPLSRGGSNGIENLQWLCATCNLRKNAKDNAEWLAIISAELIGESRGYASDAARRSSKRSSPPGTVQGGSMRAALG